MLSQAPAEINGKTCIELTLCILKYVCIEHNQEAEILLLGIP